MEEKEMEPDSGVYVSLVSSFLLSGNISAGFGIFREMVCKGRFPVLVDRNCMLAIDAADKFAEDYRTSCYITCLIKDGEKLVAESFEIQYTSPGMHTGISQLDKAVKATQIHRLTHHKTYFDSKKIYAAFFFLIYAALHLVDTRIDLIVDT
ncbi:hypothetical protein YC2023_020950 [Brassica napus]